MTRTTLEKWREWLWLPLFSLSLLWAFITGLRRKFYPYLWRYRCRIPVICVGNIHSGGSGKTPLVCALAERAQEKRVVIVSRGYKGRRTSSGAKISLDEKDGAREYGDEPWMLATRLKVPVYVGKRRSEVLRVVEALEEAELVLMDDGFQHLAVHRDLDIVLINPEKPLAERYCLPYGDLREPLSSLGRADAICLTSSGSEFSEPWLDFLKSRYSKIPRFELSRVEDSWSDGTSLLASPPEGVGAGFCGIASPQSFRQMIAAWPRLQLIETFPDHHAYNKADIEKIVSVGEKNGASFYFTTEKDWAKVANLFEGRPLFFLRMRYEIPPAFWTFLQSKVGGVFV